MKEMFLFLIAFTLISIGIHEYEPSYKEGCYNLYIELRDTNMYIYKYRYINDHLEYYPGDSVMRTYNGFTEITELDCF